MGQISPNAIRLASILTVSEEWSSWMIGKLVALPDVTVELGWEHWQQWQAKGKTFPHTPLGYIAMWRGKQVLYEFQAGRSLVKPDHATQCELLKLVQAFHNYVPFNLPPRVYARENYELPLQSVSLRQDPRNRQPVNRRKRGNQKKTRVCRLRVPVYHS